MSKQAVVKMERWEREYYSIKTHAIKYKMRNTLLALEMAVKCHEGTYRDGGEPYIIHPLMVAKTLILLRLEELMGKWFYHLSKDEIRYQCDILYSGALLHDVLEDCFITPRQLRKCGLDEEVIQNVKILTKKKKSHNRFVKWIVKILKPFDEDKYFEAILSNWKTTLIKIADRENNCSTMEVFKEQRLRKYVYETRDRFYKLCRDGKVKYPEFSDAIEIMLNSIIADVEIVATLLDMQDAIADENEHFERTFLFIEEYSRNGMPNTHKALYIARKFHAGQTRTSGDSFLIHPLRVCSYLISIGIPDDILCATMLLHEIPRRTEKEKGYELLREFEIDEEVIELVWRIPKKEGCNASELTEYYNELRKDWRAIIGRLANKAHTCTKMATLSFEQKKEYIRETREEVVPMCDYAVSRYPEYANQIDIMKHHVTTICNIVEALIKKQST